MRHGQLMIDGLWHCLCPAFSTPTLLHAAIRPVNQRLVLNQTCRLSIKSGKSIACRHLATEAPRDLERTTQPDEVARTDNVDTSRSGRSHAWKACLLAAKPPSDKKLLDTSTDDIVSALMSLRGREKAKSPVHDLDRHARVIELVTHLVTKRNRPADAFIYECLVDAMISPQGSLTGLRKLLRDMEAQGVKPTAGLCQSALDVLMNHPDYILRQEILKTMEEYWFPIDLPAKQAVLIGMLRERQYELAYSKLAETIGQGNRVEPWVLDIFILVFGRLGFLDEMVTLLHRRKADRRDTIVASLFYYALDVCSESNHHEGTVLGWNNLVRNGVLRPPDGILEGVLATAARHGDIELATEALDYLASRTKVQDYHYEAVAEAFIKGNDIAGAIRIFCIMERTAGGVVPSMTAALRQAMNRHVDMVDVAEETVWEISKKERIPLAVLEAVIAVKSTVQGGESAMALFEGVETMSGYEGTPLMVSNLLLNCNEEQAVRSLCQTYTKNFTLEDEPERDAATLRVLIQKCARAGELNLAIRFAKQALLKEPSDKDGEWVRPLIEEATAREDKRIWAVIDKLLRRSDAETIIVVKKMLQRSRLLKRAEERSKVAMKCKWNDRLRFYKR